MREDRGAVLVFALLLASLFLVMGIGFLSQRASQNRAAKSALLEAQAQACAEAGLLDAQAKFSRWSSFPPLEDERQRDFSYVETVRDSGGNTLGSYEVTLDMTYAQEPHFIVRVSSVGRAGSSGSGVEVSYKGEFDVAVMERIPSGRDLMPNERYLQYLFVERKVGAK
jgi:Tfp pilus assembly protein PilX